MAKVLSVGGVFFRASDPEVNLVVDDLDGALAQVEEGGAKRVGEIQEFDYGRF